MHRPMTMCCTIQYVLYCAACIVQHRGITLSFKHLTAHFMSSFLKDEQTMTEKSTPFENAFWAQWDVVAAFP